VIHTIDCHYTGRPGIAAAYLIVDGDEVAFVETNTTPAVPLLLEALAAAGRKPEDVRWVIVTHIHLDHAGGAGALMAACPNATLLAHPKAAPHAIDPRRIVAGATQVYGEATFAELYGEITPVPAERVRSLEDGATVTLGSRTLRFLHTRGHANHHFVVHDTTANAVFTGDSFGILYPDAQVHGVFCFPSTSPTDFDPEAAHASVDRIVATGADAVYPTHFGRHGDLPILAEQLHTMLDAHAAILEEADTRDLDGDELDAFCRERVTALFDAELAARGLSDDAVVREITALDVDLNAQGVAFALQKRRYKRRRAAQ
jgi:glyoxylase-like metal-dependent hydrolase (beta-lactamase superfamily II)